MIAACPLLGSLGNSVVNVALLRRPVLRVTPHKGPLDDFADYPIEASDSADFQDFLVLYENVLGDQLLVHHVALVNVVEADGYL